MDPTQSTVITYTRNDGATFRINELYVFVCRGPNLKETICHSYEEVEQWLKKHSLPSMKWLGQQIEARNMAYAEDPYGHPSQYE